MSDNIMGLFQTTCHFQQCFVAVSKDSIVRGIVFAATFLIGTVAKVPYTKEDLDWMDKKSRSTIEMNDKSFRPELADTNAEIDKYDTIFVGFPIWWYVAPTIINTFLESYDFSGKKIVAFATSGGSGFGKTLEELRVSVSEKAELIQGELMNGKQSFDKVNAWIKKLNV